MAAKPIDKAVTDAILIDWRVGQLSQQDLAAKHKVSKGVVNRICKGVPQDAAAIVTAGVQYQQALSGHDDRMVTAVTTAVSERIQIETFFKNANLLVAKTVTGKVQREGQQASFKDLNAAASALGRTQESVLGKSPDTVINNTNSSQATVVLPQTPEEVRRVKDYLESLAG